mgnify:CR=1 FL=1
MNGWLLEPTYWSWWLLGVILLGIEAIAPGFFLLWLGIAALLVGLLLAAFPDLPWTWQVLLFAVLAVGSITAWRWRLRRYPTRSNDPLLNRRGHQYVCLLYTSPSPRDGLLSRMPSSA